MSAFAAFGWLASGPVPPGIRRVPAQRLARAALAQSVWERILKDISRFLNSLSVGPQSGGWWGLIGLILVVVVIVAGVVYRLGPVRRSRRQRAGGVLGGSQLTAAGHRRNAEQLAAGGDYAGAIIERVRAIAVELEARGVLSPRPGRTASELAAELAGPLPGSAGELREAARLFDDVRYGGRPGTPAGYERVRALDESIQAARTPAAAAAAPGPTASDGRPQ
jgi:hypothetical protein